MKRNINYEWNTELWAVDSNGECLDVLDCNHSNECPCIYELEQLDEIWSDHEDVYSKAHGLPLRKYGVCLERQEWEVEYFGHPKFESNAFNKDFMIAHEKDFVYDFTGRTYAYLNKENGVWTLPSTFDYGHKVPKRFHEELRKVQS